MNSCWLQANEWLRNRQKMHWMMVALGTLVCNIVTGIVLSCLFWWIHQICTCSLNTKWSDHPWHKQKYHYSDWTLFFLCAFLSLHLFSLFPQHNLYCNGTRFTTRTTTCTRWWLLELTSSYIVSWQTGWTALRSLTRWWATTRSATTHTSETQQRVDTIYNTNYISYTTLDSVLILALDIQCSHRAMTPFNYFINKGRYTGFTKATDWLDG